MNKKEFEKYEHYYTNDIAIPYKVKNGNYINIKPVTVDKYFEFRQASYCITMDKDKIPDPKVLSMSYLEYLLYLVNTRANQNELEIASIMEYSFLLLISLCFDDVIDFKVMYDKKNKPFLRFTLEQTEEDILSNNKNMIADINRKEFDDIKDIILFQNIPSYDNAYIDPDVQEEMNTMAELKSKNLEMPSFEMEKITLSINSNYKLDEINRLTLRKFRLMSSQSDDIINYQIYKQAELGGMVTFKQEIDHYLYKKKKSKTNGALLDYSGFKEKMKKVSK